MKMRMNGGGDDGGSSYRGDVGDVFFDMYPPRSRQATHRGNEPKVS